MDFKERQKGNMNCKQMRMEIEKWRRNFKLTKRKETIKQRKSAEMYLEINNTSLERSEPYYALYSMKI